MRSRLLDAAQGNPLALLELPLALSDSQRAAAGPLPSVLPLSQRLQELFISRVASLPPETRALLLAAALEGAADLRVLAAAGGRDYRLEDLAPAERDGLVRAGERRVAFRHPLIRFAAVQAATLAERHRAHRALAAALADRPELRAWHLGEACIEPDEQVAGLLEKAARAILRRGDYSGAVARLTRAAAVLRSVTQRSSLRCAPAGSVSRSAMAAAPRAAKPARTRDRPPSPEMTQPW